MHEDAQLDPSDEERAWIAPLLPPPSERGRPRTTDLWEVLNALMFMGRTACQWRNLSRCFPPVSTVQEYTWRNEGLFEQGGDMLRGLLRRISGRSEEPGVIDSQRVKTAEYLGRDAGKKINGRKRHVVVDTDGLPPVQRVHEASIQDRDGTVPLIRELADKFPMRSLGPMADTRVRNCGPDCPRRA